MCILSVIRDTSTSLCVVVLLFLLLFSVSAFDKVTPEEANLGKVGGFLDKGIFFITLLYKFSCSL